MYVRMAVSDNSIQSNLVQIGCLKFQHLVDAFSVDLVRCSADFVRSAIKTPKGSVDDLLAILVQEIKCGEMRAG